MKEIPTVQPISREELDNLSLNALIKRMDEFHKVIIVQRYGKELASLRSKQNSPSVGSIMNTDRVKEFNSTLQRKVAYKVFSFVTQMDFLEIAIGASNKLVYNQLYDEVKSWQSPNTQSKHAAIQQWGIVASRVSWEIFMDLIYLLDEKKDLKGKSKFNSLKKWLLKENNPYSYFAMSAYKAFHFDRMQRSPEIHGKSKLITKLLLLKKPTSKERNSSLELTNILLNLWPPLIEILNGKTPKTIYGEAELFDWVDTVFNGTKEEMYSTVKQIVAEMK